MSTPRMNVIRSSVAAAALATCAVAQDATPPRDRLLLAESELPAYERELDHAGLMTSVNRLHPAHWAQQFRRTRADFRLNQSSELSVMPAQPFALRPPWHGFLPCSAAT